MLNKDSKIYVAGKTGLVGSGLIRNLEQRGYKNIVAPSSKELDLSDLNAVDSFFSTARPEFVFLAAAKVGGIYANNEYPAEFIYKNLCIQNNVIHSAYKFKVEKLLFLGSSCIYPKHSQQPIKEEYLLTGPLEPTNEAYAIAKIAGVKMCEYYKKQYGVDFISAMPINLYGPNDNYDLMNAHVLPALIRKFHEAKINNSKEVVIWGTGKPLREFMHVDDLSDASIFLMNNYSGSQHVNLGSGFEVSILELAQLIMKIVEFKGELVFDSSKPDGTFRKILDTTKLNNLGWKPKISLEEGIRSTYAGFKDQATFRGK